MKARTVGWLAALGVLAGYVAVDWVAGRLFAPGVARRVLDVAWFGLIGIAFHYTTGAHRRQLTRLWTLAAKLGLDPAALKTRAPQYGEIDWALSQPPRIQFYPSTRVVEGLIARLEEELDATK